MKPTCAYPARQTLLAAADELGINVLDVRQLLWLISACPTLAEFPKVIRNMKRMLLLANNAWSPKLLQRLDLSFLPPLLDRLIVLLDKLVLPLTPANAPGGKEWLCDDEGNLDRNPFYFALANLPADDSPSSDRCFLLMAHLFIADVIVLRRMVHGKQIQAGACSLDAYEDYDFAEPWKEIRVPFRHAGLAVRDLSKQKDWARILIARMPLHLTPMRFVRAKGPLVDQVLLDAFRDQPLEHRSEPRSAMNVGFADDESKSRAWLDDRLSYISNYLLQAYGVKRRRHGHGSRGRGAEVITLEALQKLEVWDRFDQCPNEDDSDSDCDDLFDALTGRNALQGKHVGLGEHARKRGQDPGGDARSQAIRASKMFQFAFNWLAPCELIAIEIDARKRIEVLLAELEAMQRGRTEQGSIFESKLQDAEVAILPLIMLWTSSDFKRATSLRITTSRSAKLLFSAFMSPENGGFDTLFRSKVPFPPDCGALQTRIDRDRMRWDTIELNDPAELGPLIWRYAALKNKFVSSTFRQSNVFRLFNQSAHDYRSHLDAMLMEWGRARRLTPSAVSSALYGRIMSWSGNDIVATTMITGVYKQAARVPMFYASRQLGALQEIHSASVKDLRFRIQQESIYQTSGQGNRKTHLDSLLVHKRQVKPPDVFNSRSEGTIYIGTRRCPTDSELRKAISDLKAKLNQRWHLSSLVPWIEYTNLYTAYTIWFFGFATGCRPILDPFVPFDSICPIGKNGFLKDKAIEKVRPIWESEGLYRHSEYYAEYLAGTNLRYCPEHACWLLTDEGAPLTVHPATLEPILYRFLPGFSSNVHRRWMMNALWDSGCPPEIVRAWAGHSTRGNALWSKDATANYGKIGRTLLQFISPILDFLGFEPIPGCAL
jgi:hypothetical protein